MDFPIGIRSLSDTNITFKFVWPALVSRSFMLEQFVLALKYCLDCCGLWFVVCGLWFVVCGLWFVVAGPRLSVILVTLAENERCP